MSAHPAHATRAGIPLQVRFQATARSEWIKFRSVRSGPAVLLVTALTVLLGAVLLASGYRNGWTTMSASARASFDPVYTSLEGIVLAQLFIGALGVMTVTGEYSSGLIRGTFTATPQRLQLLAVKALIFVAVVWAWSTALSFGAFFLGQSLLTSPATHVAVGDPGVLTAVFGGGLYLTLVGLFGLFIGVLVRRTAGALIALFGILAILPLILSQLPSTLSSRIAEFLPSNAGEEAWKLLHGGAYSLGPWPGLAVVGAYVAATAAAAFVFIHRRDV
jgi:ABC-type transport system involved in multi-copper enzyme maturation permease subunit